MSTIGGQVTPLEKAMSLFPLSPRFSPMLVGSQQHGCLPYVISIVAAMSVGDHFLREEGPDADSESDDDDEGLEHIKNASIRAKEGPTTDILKTNHVHLFQTFRKQRGCDDVYAAVWPRPVGTASREGVITIHSV